MSAHFILYDKDFLLKNYLHEMVIAKMERKKGRHNSINTHTTWVSPQKECMALKLQTYRQGSKNAP